MRGLLALTVLLVLGSLSGCGPGAECVLDTDCPFEANAYCSAEHVCVPRGTGREDAGTVRDAGVADAADAAVRDGGPSDAPRNDTPPDVPASSCPAVAGRYPLTRAGIECSGLTASTLELSGPASASDCSFEVALDGGIVGAVAQTTGNTFGGTLSVLGGMSACTFAFAEDLRSVDVTCGRCLFSAAMP